MTKKETPTFIWEQREYFDQALNPLGFEWDDEPYSGFSGVNYVRKTETHDVLFHASPRKKTKYYGEQIRRRQYIGHQYEFRVKTSLKARLNFAYVADGLSKFVNQINRWMGTKRVDGIPQLKNLEIWSADDAWARELLDNPKMIGLIETLIPAELMTAGTAVKISPGQISYTFRAGLEAVDKEQMQTRTEAFIQFVEMVESSPPLHEVEPIWLEKQSSGMVALVTLGGLFALIGFPTLCCVGGLVLFAVLAGS